ncbi:MAG: iron-sulfur cluster biosynthesis family protein, partial [Pseudomonadales bacterium]
MITITEPAQEYLAGLLRNQDDEVLGIRIFVNQPGTPRAETCIAYCRTEDVQEDDAKTAFTGFDAYFDNRSVPFLEEAVVDYAKEQMGGQLTIKAPNSKMPNVSDDSPIEDRI